MIFMDRVKSAAGSLVEKLGFGQSGSAAPSAAEVKGAAVSNANDGAALQYPPNLSNGNVNPAYIRISFVERCSGSKNVTTEGNKPRILKTIRLPMPDDITIPNTVTFDTEGIGLSGNAISGIQVGSDGNVTMGGQTPGQLSDEVMMTMANNLHYGLKSKFVQTMGGNVSAASLMSYEKGFVRNPYLTNIFKGVGLRTFSFTFNLVAFSEKDTQTINEIVKALRANSLPLMGQNMLFMKAPPCVEVMFFFNGKTNPFYPKITNANLDNLQIQYPSTQFRTGAPLSVQITMSITENDLVLSQKVAEGY